jgi:NAD(P)-dependent dehydrogenase (short-subunit alcohol dehydrogenase family)
MSRRHVSLIVGGGTGIGYAAAQRLLRRGMAIALTGRRESVLAEAKERLAQSDGGGEVITIPGDASVEAHAQQIVESAMEQLGRINFCVNCAGIYEPVHLLDMEQPAWQRTVSSNLDAVVYTSVAVAREMVKTGGGRFVLISSINSPLSEPESAHYSAAKAAVSSLARSLAVDLACHNIQANAIAPGWIDTAIVKDFIQNATPETLSRLNILGRVGQPDEIANVIEYLLLDAPEYLTGATIFVDGGQTAMAPLI